MLLTLLWRINQVIAMKGLFPVSFSIARYIKVCIVYYLRVCMIIDKASAATSDHFLYCFCVGALGQCLVPEK